MKKNILTILVLATSLVMTSCGTQKAETLSDIDDAFCKLEAQDSLSYEYVVFISKAEENSEQKYIVATDQKTGDWNYSMYLDENLISEYKCENGEICWKTTSGEWNAVTVELEPPFIKEIVPEEAEIETLHTQKENGNLEIEITLNEDALSAKKNEIVQAGEDAVEQLEKSGVSEEAVQAQMEQNESLSNIAFHYGTLYYTINSDGVLIAYKESFVYSLTDVNQEENGDTEVQTEICLQVVDYTGSSTN